MPLVLMSDWFSTTSGEVVCRAILPVQSKLVLLMTVMAASEETDKYPIELFEDPFFDPGEVDALLKCLEKWRGSLQEEDKDAFLIVESLLLEAKGRGVGIYFKF